MSSNRTSILFVVIVASFSLRVLQAQDAPSSTETRLREALRSTAAQLNDTQNQVVTLQATQAQSDKDNSDLKAKVDTLTAQVAALTKQSADDKAASDKAIADLNAQVTDLTGQTARLNEALTEWKNAYNQVVQLATAKEQARAKFALQAALLQRTVDDREAKNIALYKTGSEILTRYEKFGLGDAISAKEPFVGITRVKLENLVQDYKDKLLNQTVTSGQAPGPSIPASSPSAHPAAQTGQQSTAATQ
jgi:septal ring factor EnvC (AmiA/AmiB activator)